MEKRQVEILAPAGSFDSMKAAVAAGADAVYMGGSRFGARAYADNPDEKGLLEAIDYVHLHGRRLYMTVNTLFKEDELKELENYMLPYCERGLDGVIVQDLGALAFMRRHFPGLELHSSTQMTVTSVYGARMMKEMGCSRVVTAREMSLEEIRRIHDEADIEIESFVHGALCYCYSGQCLMSSLIGGRSGNRGRCAQPCRLPYSVYEPGDISRMNGKHSVPEQAGQAGARSRISEQTGKKNRGKKPASSGQPGPSPLNKSSERYVLSLKDLCTLDILPDIIEAGVYSLKIEGRMKSPRYTAGVVSIYRKYVDRYLEQGRDGYCVEPEDRKMLLDLFDRGGFTDGYYARHNGRGMVALREKTEFREGNQKLFEYLDKTYVEAELKEKVRGHVELAEGEPSRLTLECRKEKVQVLGQAPQAAEKQPMTREKVLKQLNKTGGSPFCFETLTAQIEGDLFLPVQALNELRRTGFQELETKLTGARAMTGEGGMGAESRQEENGADGAALVIGHSSAALESRSVLIQTAAPQSQPGLTQSPAQPPAQPVLTAFLEETAQLSPVLARGEISVVYLDADGFSPDQWRDIANRCHDRGKQCWLALPQIFRSHAQRYLGASRHLLCQAGFDGVLIRALEETVWLKDLMEQEKPELPLPFGMDASVYGWNSRSARVLASVGASMLTMPWELNSRELEPVLASCRGLGLTSELIIYGNAPMMVSAQCITNTVKGCTHKRGTLMMKDRTGAVLPVKNHCSFCYNTIYNPAPLSLLGSEKLVRRLMAERLRLQFTVEGTEQTEKVLDAFIGSFVYDRDVEVPFRDFTRGHFKRGVE